MFTRRKAHWRDHHRQLIIGALLCVQSCSGGEWEVQPAETAEIQWELAAAKSHEKGAETSSKPGPNKPILTTSSVQSTTEEAADGCAVDIDPFATLLVTDPAILEGFTLTRVLDHLIARANVEELSADALFQQWWSTQRARTSLDDPDLPFCDDDEQTINGFPIDCPRPEAQFDTLELSAETHQPVALVNRMDLAPLDGEHCGEYRIVFAKRDIEEGGGVDGRNFVIFEAHMPNPHPECGMAACRPIAEMWAGLTGASVEDQTDTLENFYFVGLEGFPAALEPDHLGMNGGSGGYGASSTGQIRSNQFVDSEVWTLREFRLERQCVVEQITVGPKNTPTLTPFSQGQQKAPTNASFSVLQSSGGSVQTVETCRLLVHPQTVKSNPFIGLWEGEDALSNDFQIDFIFQFAKLLKPEDFNELSMSILDDYNAGESISQSRVAAGANVYDPDLGFSDELEAALPANSTFTASQIAERATTQGCAGCHELSSGQFLGPGDPEDGTGLSWPNKSPRFVFIDEEGDLSNLLTMEGGFLDHRQRILERILDITCDVPCLTGALEKSLDGDLVLPGEGPLLDNKSAFDGAESFHSETLSGHLTH